MTVYFAEGVSTTGRNVWLWVPAIAARAAATVAELTASGVVMLQMVVRPGSLAASADTARIEDRRLGASITYEDFGTTRFSLATAILIDRPQDAAGAATSKHLETLIEGATGFLVNRRGLGSSPENWQAIAAAQRYILYPAKAGPQVEVTPTDDTGGQFEVSQDFIVTGPRVKGVVAT